MSTPTWPYIVPTNLPFPASDGAILAYGTLLDTLAQYNLAADVVAFREALHVVLRARPANIAHDVIDYTEFGTISDEIVATLSLATAP